jgi:predicted RNase H-like HicB family nuclease
MGKSGMRYAIVIEKGNGNYSAYSPDLPGCVTTGHTVEETRQNMAEAIQFHLESLALHGETIPPPQSVVDYVDAPIGSPALS